MEDGKFDERFCQFIPVGKRKSKIIKRLKDQFCFNLEV
jgi:hypothetical protein